MLKPALIAAALTLGSAAAAQTEPVTYTVFWQVQTTPAWLALPVEDRFAFLGAVIEPILASQPAVAVRFFDSEFYSTTATDVIMMETQSLPAYQSIVEQLRETPFWGTYFDVVAIIPAVENAYAAAYGQDPVGD
jgi:hypothetical protein